MKKRTIIFWLLMIGGIFTACDSQEKYSGNKTKETKIKEAEDTQAMEGEGLVFTYLIPIHKPVHLIFNKNRGY